MALSQTIELVKQMLPDAKLMPLFKTASGLRPAFECYSKDWSTFDWDNVYVDTNSKTGESFKRIPDWYAVCGCESYIIIDIDNKNGHDAEQSLDRLIEQGLDTDTFTVTTKTGGYHLYFNYPGYDVKTMANFIPGVDIRGRGGYVVGPRIFEDSPHSYDIVRAVAPIDLTIPLPIASAKHSLPTLDDMQLSIVPDYENMLNIPLGMRDQALLTLSGKWHTLPDNEIAERFKKLHFQQLPGDEITLDSLMAKVARDRAKSSKKTIEIADYLLNRFVYVLSEDKVYDLETDTLKLLSDLYNFYPAMYTYQKGDKVANIPQIKFWLGHPNRVTVKGLRFKPGAPKIFTVRGQTYINTYMPPAIKPWHQPVSAEDPDIHEFFMVVDLITNHNQHIKDLYLSQRAAKLQDLTWTPSWGFVLISHHQQVGKDLTAHIFSQLLGAHYCRTIKKYDLLNDRQEYNYEKLFVVLNEPGGLARGAKGLETLEILKEFMSARKGTARLLYKNTSDEVPIYKVPEIHSNVPDSFEIAESRARFAPIIITGRPLPLEVYKSLKSKQNDEDLNCPFYRKLLRFFLDYPVNAEIQELVPPLMPDIQQAKVISKSPTYQEIVECINGKVGLFFSPLQTLQSLTLAITTSVTNGDTKTAKHLCRLFVKDTEEFGRCRGVSLVEYDKSNIHSEVNRITLLPVPKSQMVTVFKVRPFTPEEQALANDCTTNQKIVDKLFFKHVNS
jgi:hypothetical protein